MDSFQLQNIKVEKANKMLKHKRIQKFTALFRLIEACVFLIIVSRSSTLLNINFKFSGEYIKGLFVTLVSPGSVFIIGNVIVITLFLKSGQPSSEADSASRPPQGSSISYQEGSRNGNKLDVYDEYVESCQRSQAVKDSESEAIQVIGHHISTLSLKEKRMQKSRSHNGESSLRHGLILRRSATETCLMKSVDRRNPRHSVNEMTNEEFNCRVEAFIARQQRLLRLEEEEEEGGAELTAFVAVEAY